MTRPAHLDWETRSAAGYVWHPPGTDPKKPLGYWGALPNAPQQKKGLPIVGTAAYAEHPSTDIICLSYDLQDGLGRRRWRPGMPLPADLVAHVQRGGLLKAHNAMFERLIWEKVAVVRYGFPTVRPEQWRCSMATARVNNLPGGLGVLSDVLNLRVKKDKEGGRLITKFSMPRNPTKSDPRAWIAPHEEPAEAEKFYTYCDVDVESEIEASDRMEPMSEDELRFWLIDQEINHRGLGVDSQGVADCIAILDEAMATYGAECLRITGGIEATQLQALRGWLAAHGVELPDMQGDTVEEAVKRLTVPGVPVSPALRVLQIRELIGSASVKKVYAMAHQMSRDGRLRNLIVHHGARTGRPTGEGPQPLNLPKAGPQLVVCGACERPHKAEADACPWCGVPCPPIARKGKWKPDFVAHVLEVFRHRSLALAEWYFGDAVLAVQGCVRGLFQAGPGKDLIASDYSAIEAVVAAMVAGEKWREEVFRALQDIYLVSAGKITKRDLQFYLDYQAQHGDKHPDRQKVGKVAELALGFGGWVGAWRAFDPDEASKSDEEIISIILAWRDASPQIVAMWGGQRVRDYQWRDELYGIEGAIIQAIQRPGEEFIPRPPSVGGIAPFPCPPRFVVRGDILRMKLPSGREIKYHEPRLRPSDKRPGSLEISYMTWNSNPKYGALGWVRMATWGSRVFENYVQGVAHCLQRFGIEGLQAAGYPIVLHVYDENVAEVPEGWGSVEEFERIMQVMPAYATGWPVRASGGWRGKRYRKD